MLVKSAAHKVASLTRTFLHLVNFWANYAKSKSEHATLNNKSGSDRNRYLCSNQIK